MVGSCRIHGCGVGVNSFTPTLASNERSASPATTVTGQAIRAFEVGRGFAFIEEQFMSQQIVTRQRAPRAAIHVGAHALATCVVVMQLAACATSPPAKIERYVGPSSGPTAKLVMRGAVSSGDMFGVFVYDDAEQCKTPRLAGAGNPTRNPASTTLTANTLTTVEFMLVKPSKRQCAIRWTFTPEAGKSYVVSGAATSGGCLARVLDATDPDNIRPEPAALRRDAAGTACVPLAQARKASTLARGGGGSGEAVLNPNASTNDLQGLIAQ